ncbi:unnamed protein product [Ilex paraguariensis]|uniref:Uncharacterized protein n=1 Tax=Ilex paraguariensis TaxID=185542 RepID=A0ABC8SSR9_9AQUA
MVSTLEANSITLAIGNRGGGVVQVLGCDSLRVGGGGVKDILDDEVEVALVDSEVCDSCPPASSPI